jgi:hypothetical protein
MCLDDSNKACAFTTFIERKGFEYHWLQLAFFNQRPHIAFQGIGDAAFCADVFVREVEPVNVKRFVIIGVMSRFNLPPSSKAI